MKLDHLNREEGRKAQNREFIHKVVFMYLLVFDALQLRVKLYCEGKISPKDFLECGKERRV